MNNQPKLMKLVYRIHVPTMGTTLEFANKRAYNEYLELFTQKGWKIHTDIKRVLLCGCADIPC